MPNAMIVITMMTALLLTVGGAMIGFMKMTAPNSNLHAATVTSCTPAEEISAVTSFDSSLSGKLTGSPGAGTGTTAAGQPVIGRVVGKTYVVTVGAGKDAKTCAVPLAQRSL